MPGLKLRDLIFAPSRKSIAANTVWPHADGRIGGDHVAVHGMVQQQPENLEEGVGGCRSARLRGDDVLDVLAPELGDRLVAVEPPEVLDDAAVIGLGDVLDVEKV